VRRMVLLAVVAILMALMPAAVGVRHSARGWPRTSRPEPYAKRFPTWPR
jgi:hypothetical protein